MPITDSRQECFVIIKCHQELGYFPQKVIAPIPAGGISEYLKNELADLPSLGGGAWQQAAGRLAEKKNSQMFSGLQNILAAESLWVGGNKRIFTLDLEFHAYEDPYREVYLPIKALQLMTLPREANPSGSGFLEKAQKGVGKLTDAAGIDTFYYSHPPNISFIVMTSIETTHTEISQMVDNYDPSGAAGFYGPNTNPRTSKNILIYVPKAIIGSLSVSWEGPYVRSHDNEKTGVKSGVYPSTGKVQIQIDTLKVCTTSDITAYSTPLAGEQGSKIKLRGISKTYTY